MKSLPLRRCDPLRLCVKYSSQIKVPRETLAFLVIPSQDHLTIQYRLLAYQLPWKKKLKPL
jgi:hypothetical protein